MLRHFPGRGHRIWGARTHSADGLLRYVPVRRLLTYLERSIQSGTSWAVYEPNGERLWSAVRDGISSFLIHAWRGGALVGASPREALFVRCDRTTMTQDDIDNGRLICEVGVAPLRPAEFVLFRIEQRIGEGVGG